MKRFKPSVGSLSHRINFLDATGEEVMELVRSLVCELSIMTCFLTMTPEKKKVIEANIASFRTYLGEPAFKQ